MQVLSPETKSLLDPSGIADEINAKFREAIRFAGESARNGRAAIVAAIECGELLNAAKESCKHGKWEAWLFQHCGDISQVTACKWMRLAKLSHSLDLSECNTLRQAYIATGILPEPAPKAPKPIGTEEVTLFDNFVTQVAKVCDMVRKWKLDKIPEPKKDEIRQAIARVKELEGKL